MKDATHFIEVYKRNSGITVATPLLDMPEKQEQLDFTSSLSSLKTIYVWNIKKKTLPK